MKFFMTLALLSTMLVSANSAHAVMRSNFDVVASNVTVIGLTTVYTYYSSSDQTRAIRFSKEQLYKACSKRKMNTLTNECSESEYGTGSYGMLAETKCYVICK